MKIQKIINVTPKLNVTLLPTLLKNVLFYAGENE